MEPIRDTEHKAAVSSKPAPTNATTILYFSLSRSFSLTLYLYLPLYLSLSSLVFSLASNTIRSFCDHRSHFTETLSLSLDNDYSKREETLDASNIIACNLLRKQRSKRKATRKESHRLMFVFFLHSVQAPTYLSTSIYRKVCNLLCSRGKREKSDWERGLKKKS